MEPDGDAEGYLGEGIKKVIALTILGGGSFCNATTGLAELAPSIKERGNALETRSGGLQTAALLSRRLGSRRSLML